MKEDITSIPISDVFDPKEGCPLCRLYDILEERSVSYTVGAAMMEPDVRQETNKLGFCHKHYEKMLGERRRLGVALILESHLDELLKTEFSGVGALLGKSRNAKKAPTCFICRKIEHNMEQFTANICRLYGVEKDFKKLYGEQEYLCLPHYHTLVNCSDKVAKREKGDFLKVSSALAKNKLQKLKENVTLFCGTYNYQSEPGSETELKTRDSVEKAIEWLTGEKTE